MLLQNGERRIERLEYNAQPVVAFEQIDGLHGYYPGTSKRTFCRYQHKLVQGRDYLILPFAAWSKIAGEAIRSVLETGYNSDKIFLTRSGYLMLIKRFKDNLAWQVHQMALNGENVFDKLLYCPSQSDTQGHTPGNADYKDVLRKTLEETALISNLLNKLLERNKTAATMRGGK